MLLNETARIDETALPTTQFPQSALPVSLVCPPDRYSNWKAFVLIAVLGYQTLYQCICLLTSASLASLNITQNVNALDRDKGFIQTEVSKKTTNG
jgi:hypothetical protein